MKKFLFGGLCFLGLSMLFFSLPVDAHSTKSETLEGKVSRVLVASQLYQKLQVVVTSGSFKEQTIIVENGKLPSTNLHQYRVGDRLVIGYSRNTTGKPVYHINDYVRRTPLLWLFMIFLVATILVGGWQGATSLLGMLFSFLIIVFYILPSLSLGNNPLQAAVVGTLVITPVSFSCHMG